MAAPPFRLRRLARIIEAGGVIAYPTEAVYGLGCHPDDRLAVERVLALKQRPVAKGLILIADRTQRLAGWVDPGALNAETVRSSWPGPTTWVLPAGPGARVWISGSHDGIAVRVTAHPLAAALCAAAGTPLVSTSANIGGRRPPRRAVQVRRTFGDAIDGILVGEIGGRRDPSEIRRYPDGMLLRGTDTGRGSGRGA